MRREEELCCLLFRLQLLLHAVTSSQHFSHFFRHVKGRSHVMHVFVGRFSFLIPLGMENWCKCCDCDWKFVCNWSSVANENLAIMGKAAVLLWIDCDVDCEGWRWGNEWKAAGDAYEYSALETVWPCAIVAMEDIRDEFRTIVNWFFFMCYLDSVLNAECWILDAELWMRVVVTTVVIGVRKSENNETPNCNSFIATRNCLPLFESWHIMLHMLNTYMRSLAVDRKGE